MSRYTAYDTRPEQLEADRAELRCSFVQIDGVKTAVYTPETINKRRKTLLLVHGLGGSYTGMIPLGQVLAKTCNVIYVDLPGHGQSGMPKDIETLGGIESWSRELTKGSMLDEHPIDMVIGHSFGCYIAATNYQANPMPTTFLMPVVVVSRLYTLSARVVNLLRFIAIPTYNIQVWSTFRGFFLSRNMTKKTWRILSFVARTTQPSQQQLRYQLRLATQLPSYQLPDSYTCSVVAGRFDTMSAIGYKKLRQRLTNTKFATIAGGHLAPIEQAYKVANIVKQQHDL